MVVLPDELKRSDVRDAILDAVQTAYNVNVERFDPEEGDDAVSFGVNIWKSTTHFLKRLGTLDGVAVTVVNQSIEIKVGACLLRIHKLGRTELDDPYDCFPGHPGPAARMGRGEQLELRLGLEALRPLDWVIGHYGSPDEGLRAIRLQAPGLDRDVDGTISSWRHVETIYDASETSITAVPVTSGVTAPPAAIPEADIAIRKEAEADSGKNPA